MGNPVVHFEVRGSDPDSMRSFYGQLFDWTFADAPEPGYKFVVTGVDGAIPGGIGKAQSGTGHVTFFVDVDNVAAALSKAEQLGGRIILPAQSVPGTQFGLFADPEGHVVGVSHND